MIDHDKPPIDVTALNTSWGWAAGGIVSTTEDLTHFLKAIATSGYGGPRCPDSPSRTTGPWK